MEKPHYHGHRNRLKKKFLQNGIESLHDYEIIELLLFYSIPVKDTKPLAKELLKKHRNIKGIFSNLNFKNFNEIKGLGENSYILFKLIKEIQTIIEKEKIFETKTLDNLEKVIKYAKVSIGDSENEVLKVLCLNSKNELLNDVVVDEGTANEIYIYPRKIIKIALEQNATALILIHNHPSGSVKPSKADIIITKKLENLLSEINIKLHDHIIVSKNSFFSFRKERLL